jgi:hypothetical protein
MAAQLTAIADILEEHRESKVKAVQTLIEEIGAVLYDEEVADADVP